MIAVTAPRWIWRKSLSAKDMHLPSNDQNVHISKLVGANKAFIDEHLPHLSELIQQ